MKLFILGSTGDLVKRKVLPALHKFENLEIYVLGRKDLDNEEYNKEYCKKCSEEFKLRLNYIHISFENNLYSQIEKLLDKEDKNYFYISMPPNFIFNLLGEIIEIKKKNFNVRILIEKPFGSNLEEAQMLADLINKNRFQEEIYLSDHYLFKENVFNLKETKFTELNIVSNEEIGIEGRIYYDSIGALKDMIQSHFLNILHKLVEFSIEDVEIKTVKFGQYKDYKKEIGKESNTETYVEVIFDIKDKEVIFETGKKLPERESFIELDNIKIDIASDKECYFNLFNSFFKEDKENFPTVKNAIVNWKVVEKIEKENSKLDLY